MRHRSEPAPDGEGSEESAGRREGDRHPIPAAKPRGGDLGGGRLRRRTHGDLSSGLEREAPVPQRRRELRGAPEAVGGQLLQRLRERVADVSWYGPSLARNRRRVRGENLDQHRLGGRRGEGRPPGKHLVQNTAERVDIPPGVHVTVARRLLWTHVVGRSELDSRLGDTPASYLGHSQRDTKVGDEWLAVLEQDVGGLDVPVDHPVPVRVFERARDLLRDRQ